MSIIDWVVLGGTLAFIVFYGSWKTRKSSNIDGYLLGDRNNKWWTICLSIMATQASAITFLSTPGQAYQDGMRFIQFYLGLPVAMIIISITAVPIYNRLKVFTAYEYLESRFDHKTRSLAAILFLIQRGLSTGITIYAPAIILSTILGWSVNITSIIIGILVIIYTVAGGTKAVSVTHRQQMAVIFGGMFLAGYMVVHLLPENVSFPKAVGLAGTFGKMNIIDFKFDLKDRYNFWSGMIGGLFLALSYFGTDQSQVARYLSGESITESRMGLLFNGLLKIPMQFFILLLGSLLFVFYQFHEAPYFFNNETQSQFTTSVTSAKASELRDEYHRVFSEKKEVLDNLVKVGQSASPKELEQYRQRLKEISLQSQEVKVQMREEVLKHDSSANVNDSDYVFISFITSYLPHGLIGLLLAVIFSAAMSSTASGLNSLASTSCVDIYKRSIKIDGTESHYVSASRWLTVLWGLIAILFAILASFLENLIQAVNILGSLFYGTILGIFLAAFYFKYLKSNAVFVAAVIAEAVVIIMYFKVDISYLWYNLIGCFLVIFVAFLIQVFFEKRKGSPNA
ncbi:MAG TPA: sodium:solute symporter [Cytophagaceae bacterium]